MSDTDFVGAGFVSNNTELTIELPTKEPESFRAQKLVGMFELKPEHLVKKIQAHLKLPEDWNVGLIVGRSGTGKSTIAQKAFGSRDWDSIDAQLPIIDAMPGEKSVEEITKTFTQVGFSSPPSWLKPYTVLSNGEKMRVQLASALLSSTDCIMFDEFTSVVDRDVAKVVSRVIQKNVRAHNKKFVAVTCHYDVEDWLEPDWIFSTDEMKMLDASKKKDQLSSKFTDQALIRGDCLEIITI